VESKPAFVDRNILANFPAANIRLSRSKALHPRFFEEATVSPPFHQTRLRSKRFFGKAFFSKERFVSFLFRETTLSDVSFVSITAGVAGLSSLQTLYRGSVSWPSTTQNNYV